MAATPEASSSAFSQVVSATSNATSHLTAFPADLAHFLANAASFAFIKFPERIENIFHGGGSVIAQATGNDSGRIISAAMSGRPSTAPASSTARQLASLAGTDTGTGGLRDVGSLAFHHLRTLGGFFSYVTSKWALATTVLALVLNRTQIYASMRRSLQLRWPIRLGLRLAPIFLLLSQTMTLLQAVRCQTSPRYSQMRYGDPAKPPEVDFAGDGGFLYWLTSKMLFLESEEDSCLAIGIISPTLGEGARKGTLSLLWPLFQVFWLSHFVETIITVLQGRTPANETGMSIFEHSLAFAEAEGMLSNTLGLSPFRLSKSSTRVAYSQHRGGVDTTQGLLQQMNTPPENLLIGLISTLNNLSSQVLGVLDKQAEYRLLNTGAWGLCYLAAFSWGFYSLVPEAGPDNIIMRFPVVCIVGFTPHLLILVGISICISIYALALTLCFFSPPPEIVPLPLRARIRWAFFNMQAYTHIANLRIEMRQDFYTALLQLGFMALTAASEAVFLNERQKVIVARWTWLEDQRMDEFENATPSADANQDRSQNSSKHHQQTNPNLAWSSGYANQKVHKVTKQLPPEQRRGVDSDGGIGAFKRVRRIINVYNLFTGIFWLLGTWMKMLLNKSLDKAGVSHRPHWLRVSKSATSPKGSDAPDLSKQDKNLDFWLLSKDGVLSLPEDDNVDVEQETQRRLTIFNENRQPPTQEQLSSNLYDWWKYGGWWGERDGSGSYTPSNMDNEDTTSMISMSTNASDWSDEDESEALRSGRTTPTQRHPYPKGSCSPTPSIDHALDPAHLASLLDPKDAATRQQAKMLAYHLTAPSITTRSRYAHAQTFASAKIITSTRYRPSGTRVPANGPLTAEEETQLLEQLILSRRSKHNEPQAPASASSADAAGESWATGGLGMGSSGPSCVVCQNAPRTVIAWPCRCLSLCEDCRVSLAMNNFGTCVCCRQDVVGFSRLFVP